MPVAVQREHGWLPSHLRCLVRQGRQAAGTEGGGADDCDVVVATEPFRTVPEEVAVPGLSLDTAGELLLEAPFKCGASGEKGSIVGNPSG